MAGCCDNGNEHSGYFKHGNCLTNCATSSVLRTDVFFLKTAAILTVNFCSVRKAAGSKRLSVLNTDILHALLQSLPMNTEATLKMDENFFL
jgi:hypothetical protein